MAKRQAPPPAPNALGNPVNYLGLALLVAVNGVLYAVDRVPSWFTWVFVNVLILALFLFENVATLRSVRVRRAAHEEIRVNQQLPSMTASPPTAPTAPTPPPTSATPKSAKKVSLATSPTAAAAAAASPYVVRVYFFVCSCV